NFAMTDYASQGKSRDFNVVDLNNCRTHYSYYTALSWSTSDGTVLLQGMSPAKITNGISGYLRQEFRELEMLNEITALKYYNRLDASVNGINRRAILRAYQILKGGKYQPPDLHDSLKWKNGDAPLMPDVDSELQTGPLIESDKPKPKKVKEGKKGRKRPAAEPAAQPKPKKAKSNVPPPVGTTWDCINYSCAYDAIVSTLYNIWQDDGAKWCTRFKDVGEHAGILAEAFESGSNLNAARDIMRTSLRLEFPTIFRSGHYLTNIDDLAEKLFGAEAWGSSEIKCTRCDRGEDRVPDFGATRTITRSPRLKSRYRDDYGISHWLKDQMIKKTNKECTCGSGMLKMVRVDRPPPLMYLTLSDTTILIDPAINITTGETRHRYALRGIIYGGENHFTSRIVMPNGNVWYHDGIETGHKMVNEGSMHSMETDYLNT
ncbi:hypothetical protein C8R44DRAFT_565621, partial [Mycena epipterygia]